MSNNRKPNNPQVQFQTLIKRMDRLTEALETLAMSNMRLAEAFTDFAEMDADGEADGQQTFMDGTPIPH